MATKMVSKTKLPERSQLMFVRPWKANVDSACRPQVKNSTNAS